MVWNAAKGGMRSVVEGYERDGLLARQDFRLIASYDDLGFVGRQMLFLKALARYAATLATQDVSLIHCHVAMRGSFWRKMTFLGLARLRGKPFVLHLHGSEMVKFYEGLPGPLQALVTATLSAATRVVVLSDSWKAYINRIAPKARVTVVPNYVTQPEPLDHPSGQTTTFLFLGLVGVRKGVFDLLQAFADALAVRQDLRLIIGGNGAVDEARVRAQALGVAEKVDFLGWIGPDDRDRLLRASDVFLLPSHNEGLPMSVLEAMAYSLPVITTTVGGIPELIQDGVNGRMLPPGDIPALTAALLELAGDPAARARLGQAAYATVQAGYSADAVLPRLDQIYAECQAAKAA